MKKQLLLCALAIATAFITATGVSAQSANFVFTPMTISAAPGSTITFRIDLNVTTGGNLATVNGMTYFLQQTNNASNLIFSVVARNTGDNTVPGAPAPSGGPSPFRFAQFSDSDFNPSAGGSADPLSASGNSMELGRLTANNAGGDLTTGMYFVADITLKLAVNAPAGTYTVASISTGGKTAVLTNKNGDTFPIQPASITITVVPEPSTYALLAFAAVGAGVVVYRRRATA